MSGALARTLNAATERSVGYLSFIVYVARHLERLRNRELAFALARQLSSAGNSALILVVLLGLLSGGTMLSQIMPLLGENNASGRMLLISTLAFEAAPLLCALIVLARNSAGMTAELALMRLHGEFLALERIGVPAAEYLLIPRILALALVMPVLCIVFQCAALIGGATAMSLLHGLPFAQQADAMLHASQPLPIMLGLGKALGFGVFIAAISCHHGIHAERSPLAVSRESIQAVGRGLAAVILLDGICAGLGLLLGLAGS